MNVSTPVGSYTYVPVESMITTAFEAITRPDPLFEAELNRFYDLKGLREFADLAERDARPRDPVLNPRGEEVIDEIDTCVERMLIERLDALIIRIVHRINAVNEWVLELRERYDATEIKFQDGRALNLNNIQFSTKQQCHRLADVQYGYERCLTYFEALREAAAGGASKSGEKNEEEEEEEEGVKVEAEAGTE